MCTHEGEETMTIKLFGEHTIDIRLLVMVAYYGAVLLMGLAYAAFIDPKGDLAFVYDFSMIRSVVQMSTSAMAIWLLLRRAPQVINFCTVTTTVCAVLSAIDLLAFGSNVLLFVRVGNIPGSILICLEYLCALAAITYLNGSGHLRQILCVPLDDSPEGEGHSWNVPYRERIKTWTFWRDTIMFFIVFSFLGHWAEMLFCQLILAGVFMGGYDPTNAMLWSQWLFPFTAEGTALAAVVLLLHPFKEHLLRQFKGRVLPALVISFLVTAFICTSIDFLTGITCNQNYELWDYRDMPFNFMGQVCLQNSMVYSIAATLIVWIFYPLMDRAIRKMPRSWANGLFFALVGIYLFESALHFVNIL